MLFFRLEQTSFIGHYQNGKPFGKAWIILIGNGALFGNVDKSGSITDDNAAYFYPGFELAIVGKFENNFLKSGRAARIKGERCHNGMKIVEIFQSVNLILHSSFNSATRGI